MSSRRLRTAPLLLSLLVSCDSRVDDDYMGRSLLHLEGRVIIADPQARDDLVPALAFSGRDGVEFMNVEARGDFPNNFSIEIYAPPPNGAIFGHEDDPLIPEGQRVAVANITAIPASHPGRMVLAKHVFSVPNSALPACATTPTCDHVERWCLDELQTDCRVVGLRACDGDCTPVLSEGNEAIQLNDDTPGSIPGLSEQHIVLWTRDGVPSSSVLSHFLGLTEDLPAGYSLVELGAQLDHDAVKDDPSLEPLLAKQGCLGAECAEEFEGEARLRYQRLHQVDPDDLKEQYEAAGDEEAYDALDGELEILALEFAIRVGFDISEYRGTKLVHDPRAKLQIRISPDVEQIFF
jgi:hypothetical protein